MGEQSTGEQVPQVGRQGWWLATRRRRAEWQSLSGAGVATFSGRPRGNFEAAQQGDPVLIYVATPDKAIRAAGIVIGPAGRRTGGGSPDGQAGDSAGAAVEVQLAFEIPNPLPWREIAGAESLREAEPVRQRSSGNLFYLSPGEYQQLRAMILDRNPELGAPFVALDSGNLPLLRGEVAERRPESRELREPSAEYIARREEVEGIEPALPAVRSIGELAAMTLLPAAMLQETLDLLLEARQIVLAGPPGTGKTWLARGLAALASGDPMRVQVTQFHPSTTYEDFVEGLKPRVNAWGQVTYAVVPGLFARLCMLARRDPANRYVLVLDEINRAPLARVFGELLYALEYRGPEGGVALATSAGSGGLFYVPENLLLIGTMNSADRSIALVDYALRRRFRFVELLPTAPVLDGWLEVRGVSARRRALLVELMQEVNRRLVNSLGSDYQIGHSYFMLPSADGRSLERLWRTGLRPLLIEYFLPNTAEVEEYETLFEAAVRQLGGRDEGVGGRGQGAGGRDQPAPPRHEDTEGQ